LLRKFGPDYDKLKSKLAHVRGLFDWKKYIKSAMIWGLNNEKEQSIIKVDQKQMHRVDLIFGHKYLNLWWILRSYEVYLLDWLPCLFKHNTFYNELLVLNIILKAETYPLSALKKHQHLFIWRTFVSLSPIIIQLNE
jgi:hypothetical protein